MIRLCETMRKASLLFMFCCIFLSARTYAASALGDDNKHELENQAGQKTISGKVTDENGESVAGANVTVKGTTVGALTNAEGRYTMTVPDNATTLVISFVGYLTQEVAIGNRSVIDFVLVSDIQALSEIVVVGYGQQRKSDITGAISSVKGQELVQLPMQRVDQALQGRAAGVLVLNTAGAPGANTTIRVRGMNSINGGNNALIVIDGLQGGKS